MSADTISVLRDLITDSISSSLEAKHALERALAANPGEVWEEASDLVGVALSLLP